MASLRILAVALSDGGRIHVLVAFLVRGPCKGGLRLCKEHGEIAHKLLH